MTIRHARNSDLTVLHLVIERAYRGAGARASWAIQVDTPDSPRTNIGALTELLNRPSERLLVAINDEGDPVGCVNVTNAGQGRATIGLLCVDPNLQTAGVGRDLLIAAEREACEAFAASKLEMSVISLNHHLIEFYIRRGYKLSGERRPYPGQANSPYDLAVLTKSVSC